MYVKLKKLSLTLSLGLMSTILFNSTAIADTVDVKGVVVVPYNNGWLSSKPDDRSNQDAMRQAKLEAWKLYTAKFNDAKMKSYLINKDKFEKNIDQYIQNISIVDKEVDKDSKSIKLVVRATVNETAVDATIGSMSQASKQATGKGTPFVFLFVSRTASSIKTFDDKRINITKKEKNSANEDRSQQSEEIDASSSKSMEIDKTTSGGSVERKKSKTKYEVSSSQDIDSAMGDVLSTSGFEVISYDDVVANCGGVDKTHVSQEFMQFDDMSTETRKSVINASRDCEVSIFATGTLDVGVQDTDPSSGNKRVIVSVRGQVWNIENKLPRKIASVGPVQFSGLGPDDIVAQRNALNLAAKEAAKVIVDQLNLKGIH
jgi:hypothetical protein